MGDIYCAGANDDLSNINNTTNSESTNSSSTNNNTSGSSTNNSNVSIKRNDNSTTVSTTVSDGLLSNLHLENMGIAAGAGAVGGAVAKAVGASGGSPRSIAGHGVGSALATFAGFHGINQALNNIKDNGSMKNLRMQRDLINNNNNNLSDSNKPLPISLTFRRLWLPLRHR